MISKYAVYEHVTKVTCHDGKERYLILCPEEERTICRCYECPFEVRYKPKMRQLCIFVRDANFGIVDTFEEVRAIIEPFYDEMFGRMNG